MERNVYICGMETKSDIEMMARVADGAAQRAGARLVLMCGISGSGKTVLSREMERVAGYKRLSMDEIIWERYGDAFTRMGAEERPAAFMAAGKVLQRRVEDALLGDDTVRVVVDATMCKHVKRAAMRELAARCGTCALVVYLPVPPDVLQERLSHRTGHGPHDQIIPAADLAGFLRGFQRPQTPPLLIL